jgi:hypothetical protein
LHAKGQAKPPLQFSIEENELIGYNNNQPDNIVRIETKAWANKGASGCPAFNLNGDLIGVLFAGNNQSRFLVDYIHEVSTFLQDEMQILAYIEDVKRYQPPPQLPEDTKLIYLEQQRRAKEKLLKYYNKYRFPVLDELEPTQSGHVQPAPK